MTATTKPQAIGVWQQLGRTALVPALAMVTALVAGSVLIVLSDFTVLDVLRGTAGPEVSLLGAIWNAISVAYGAMFRGAIGDFGRIAAALSSGEARAIGGALYPISESLVTATPYILAGLAVAVGFRCGLFNIGVEGQLFLGAVFGTFAGYAFTGLPALIHIPLALIAGVLGGALWAAIPAVLKARVGAHEVITTIMLNHIAIRLVTWLLSGPMQRPDSTNPISPFVAASAELPRLLPDPARFHIGFFVALLVAVGIWYLLFRTTIGFEIRTVGANADAAKYAGMSVTRNLVLAMCLSGGLAGLAGAIEVLGVNHTLTTGVSAGLGFESIALALLGQSHPAGVVGAALLFGTLRAGATTMQAEAQIPVDIIAVIQALVIAFIAAPAIIRSLYRIRQSGETVQTVFMRGWGK